MLSFKRMENDDTQNITINQGCIDGVKVRNVIGTTKVN